MGLDEPDISIAQLRCFIAVAEASSLAEAGRRLGMSAASVSKALARLERSVGIRLLHRSTHALSLTDEGAGLLALAREVLAAATAFRHAADDNSQASGMVRISAPVGFCRVVLAPLLAGFRGNHPNIQVEVRATNEIVALAEEGIDIALRSGPLTRTPGHVQRHWFTFPWVFCAAPDYLQRRGEPQSIEDLAGHDLIGFRNPRTGQVQAWPFRSGQHGGQRLVPDAALVFDDGDSGWQAALAGGGVACTPLWLAAAALRDGRARWILRDLADEPASFSIIRRDREFTPQRVTALVAYLLANPPDLADLL